MPKIFSLVDGLQHNLISWIRFCGDYFYTTIVEPITGTRLMKQNKTKRNKIKQKSSSNDEKKKYSCSVCMGNTLDCMRRLKIRNNNNHNHNNICSESASNNLWLRRQAKVEAPSRRKRSLGLWCVWKDIQSWGFPRPSSQYTQRRYCLSYMPSSLHSQVYHALPLGKCPRNQVNLTIRRHKKTTKEHGLPEK